MNWEALGAIAELLGAIGVIATLLYLSRQIENNSKQLEGAATIAVHTYERSLIEGLYENPSTLGDCEERERRLGLFDTGGAILCWSLEYKRDWLLGNGLPTSSAGRSKPRCLHSKRKLLPRILSVER